MLKVYIIECENAKVWTPINGGMFKTCLPEDGENDRIELQIFNVVNENKVPVAMSSTVCIHVRDQTLKFL